MEAIVVTTPGGADVTGLLEHSDLRRAARIVAAQAGPLWARSYDDRVRFLQ